MKCDARAVFAALRSDLASCQGTGLDSGMGGDMSPPVSQPGSIGGMRRGGRSGGMGNQMAGPNVGPNGHEELANPGRNACAQRSAVSDRARPQRHEVPDRAAVQSAVHLHARLQHPAPSVAGGSPHRAAPRSRRPVRRRLRTPTSSDGDDSDDSADTPTPSPTPPAR